MKIEIKTKINFNKILPKFFSVILILFFIFLVSLSLYFYWKFYLKIEVKPLNEKIITINEDFLKKFLDSEAKKEENQKEIKNLKYFDLFLKPENFPTSSEK